MELTNELKARFFALYWGQKVMFAPNNINHHFHVCNGLDLQEDWCALLRPLSSMTEEEAKELKTMKDHFCGLEMGSKRVDYVRSLGIALPFMGIPVDQWVEWGVVKLKTE